MRAGCFDDVKIHGRYGSDTDFMQGGCIMNNNDERKQQTRLYTFGLRHSDIYEEEAVEEEKKRQHIILGIVT
jgi:hypothetical protein